MASNKKIVNTFLDELKQKTLIESTASSLRLAGIKLTNAQVGQIIDRILADKGVEDKFEKLLSPKQILVWKYLQTVDEATPQEISKNAKVARPTVNQVLEKLLKYKKIERIGMGSATRYRKL